MRTEFCKACIYFVPPYDPVFQAHGTCRRFPKAEKVYDSDWCGEFTSPEKSIMEEIENFRGV